MSEHKIRERLFASSASADASKKLGDGPIERTYREKMHMVAKALDIMFNGPKTGEDRETGFVLLVFPFGEKDGRCNYISNGANRKDVITLMKEQIKRFEGQADQEGHA